MHPATSLTKRATCFTSMTAPTLRTGRHSGCWSRLCLGLCCICQGRLCMCQVETVRRLALETAALLVVMLGSWLCMCFAAARLLCVYGAGMRPLSCASSTGGGALALRTARSSPSARMTSLQAATRCAGIAVAHTSQQDQQHTLP